MPHETAAVSAQVLCTPYNHAPCHFMQSHIRKVYACLAVTCHLHFCQIDRDLLRAAAVTRGRNGYRNKIQHRKLTLEKRNSPAAPANDLTPQDPNVQKNAIYSSKYWTGEQFIAQPKEISDLVFRLIFRPFFYRLTVVLCLIKKLP